VQKYRRVGEIAPLSPDKNMDYYGTDEFYPNKPVRLIKGGIMRGKRVVRLEIYPVLYNPVKEELRLLSHITIKFKFNDTGDQTLKNPDRLSSLSFDRLNAGNLVLIPAQQTAQWNNKRQEGYLIITPDEFVAPLEPLVEWKRQKGYNVKLARTSETGADTTGIRNYIQKVYDSWEKPPTFVLLVGDTKFIPGFRGRFALNPHVRHITDLYYATMDGPNDIFPDIFVGRFPAGDTSQVRIMVEKTLFYEKLNPADPDWLNYATFIATQDKNFHELVEKGHRASIHDFFAPNGIVSDSIWTFYNASGEQLNNAVNRGTAIVTYSGHGSEMYWNDLDGADPHGFSLFDLYYLENNNRYPAVLSFGCNAGDFSKPECLGKSWLRFENRGASLFWGATDLAFWHQDYYLQEKFFTAAFEKEYDTFSQMAADALLQLFTRGYPYYDFYSEIYTLLGDPAAPYWTGKPDSFFVECPDTLAMGSRNLLASVNNSTGPVENALVAVTQNETLLGSAYTLNGKVNIDFVNPVFAFGDLTLTVSKAQHIIFSKNIILPALPLVSFTPESLTVNVEQSLQIKVEKTPAEPIPGYIISIHGFGLNPPLSAVTNSLGIAEFDIKSPYGQQLQISGKPEYAQYNTFIYDFPVKCTKFLENVNISAKTEQVRVDSFLVPRIAGTVHIESLPPADKIYVTGTGLDTVFTGNSFSILPVEPGTIHITLTKNDYRIFQSTIRVVNAYGSIDGRIINKSDSTLICNARVKFFSTIYPDTVATNTDSSGIYQVSDVKVGLYKIQIDQKGYQVLTDSLIVVQGQNKRDFMLIPRQPATISGTVRLTGLEDFGGVVVSVKGQASLDTTCVSGNYTLKNVIPDSVIIKAVKDGFKTEIQNVVVGDGEFLTGINFNLSRGYSNILENFETDNGGFTASAGWQWGKPGTGLYFRGPENAYSGENVWGTILDGDYKSFANYRLDSPDISLTGFEKPVLKFYHFYSMDFLNKGFDGGNVKISTDGGETWTLLYPVDSYPCDTLSVFNAALAGEPGFSGYIKSWEQEKFDLSSYINQHVIIRLQFGSTDKVEDADWYINDFSVYEDNNSHVFTHKNKIPARFELQQNYPNPFNSETVINYLLPEQSRVQLAVYNMLGQKVKTLVDTEKGMGTYSVKWDGKDEKGQDISAGVYILSFKTGIRTATKKMLLLR